MSLLELIFLAMLLPVVAMAGNFGFNKAPNARDGFTFIITLLTFATVFEIYRRMESRTSSRFELFEVFPGVELAFHVEPLGLLFAFAIHLPSRPLEQSPSRRCPVVAAIYGRRFLRQSAWRGAASFPSSGCLPP